MDVGVFVLLPPERVHLCGLVMEAGGIPVIDATIRAPEHIPDGAWVRIRPGHAAPGTGPVVLAEDGAAVMDRPTWLESAVARAVPAGFEGLWLRGLEAAGIHGERDVLDLLAECPEPERTIVGAGLAPLTAGVAAALGARGVALGSVIAACPEWAIHDGLRGILERPADEATAVVQGWRVANAVTDPVLAAVAQGANPWSIADSLGSNEPSGRLILADQGLAIAAELMDRHGSMQGIISAYREAVLRWPERVRGAYAADSARVVFDAAALNGPGTAAGGGEGLGSGILWQIAAWLGRPIAGPSRLAVAAGLAVAGVDDLEDARNKLLESAPATKVSPPRVDRSPSPSSEPMQSVSESTAPAVAIVGIGAVMPGANDAKAFWQNIKDGVSSIVEVPKDRWDPALFFDEDPSVPDKTYTKIGGFIQDFKFDAKRFRIPPRVASQVDPVQQLALHAVYEAMKDAGLQTDRRDKQGRPFDRERCGVILGNSLGGELKDAYALRVGWPEIRQNMIESGAFSSLSAAERDQMLEQVEAAYKSSLPVIDEDSMPGELANVIAGRVANAFDLRGPNYTTDAACASSLAALQVAVKSLQDREIDIAITGGSDRSMNIPTYVKFCKIGALSPDHSAPFNESANGFVMGEGAGVLVLKRLRDAEADGDSIYAVIRGVGASSDGKGKGITAPNPIGQRLALERAYAMADIDPSSVDLVEAHGTSTKVGDAVELQTLSDFIGPGKRNSNAPMRVGSVKSMIGHLKSAAGAAAVIKVAFSLKEGVFPPSLGFVKPREGVDMTSVPLKVQTGVEAWARPPGGLRRAGVSAFGFGGTNFHVLLEEYAGQVLPDAPARKVTAAQQIPASVPASSVASVAAEIVVPEGIWATSAPSREVLLERLETLNRGEAVPFHPGDQFRIAAASKDEAERAKQLKRAISVITKGQNPDLLRARNIYFEEGSVDGKIAFLFTGQGSQYLDMGLDLAEIYPVVKRTFEEADAVLRPTLGQGVTDLIRLKDGEDAKEKELQLRRTEFSQPATLTVDVAILRLLAQHGVFPDMVAGHSLGEYGAAVAAGIMTFEQALLAVSARGREMASIKLDDPGKMAGIAASYEVVQEVLSEVDGYVIAANKNCPSQTVIAGSSHGIEDAIEKFKERNVTVYPLPVSHAFHSEIVSPASEPLRKVLTRLGLSEARRPITTNVTGEYYPTGPGSVEKVVDNLAKQISSSVEWTAQVERMYADGATMFIECGPKRALTGFITSILKHSPHRSYATNHPKRGGVWSFRDGLAGLLTAGFPIRLPVGDAIPDLFEPAAPRRSTQAAMTAHTAAPVQAPEQVVVAPTPVAQDSTADLIGAAARAGLSTSSAESFVDAVLPAVQAMLETAYEASKSVSPPPAPAPVPAAPAPSPAQHAMGPGVWPRVVCSGAGLGLPGEQGVFNEQNLARILFGKNSISHIGERAKDFLSLGIVRLVKDPSTGQGEFVPVEDESQVIRLAGRAGHFDLTEWGVPENLIRAFDTTTQLAIAAVYSALRDAGIPLQQVFRMSASGKQIPAGWQLPESMRDDTGIVFGSAFSGLDAFADLLMNNGDDGDGRFDRRFIFRVLTMAHSQVAQLIGARGPNTAVNAACASSTQAAAIAQDWLRTGRCKRVIVCSADNVTSDRLLKWLGGGFMAAGAASTNDIIEETALPFDARRHGLILGMGANAMVLESADGAAERGVTPIAELLDATIVNSAFHGTRLHPEHIARCVTASVGRACALEGIDARTMAQSALFMSHETYTPARGGSAQGEIDALRAAFGESANQILITNTKGYTGHAMGAGIEDTVAVKALQYGIVPPVANFKVPDEALGDLRITKAGQYGRVNYALRLAAGFGSQLALSVWKSVAEDDARSDDSRRAQWLKQATGMAGVSESIEKNMLRVRPAERDSLVDMKPDFSPADVRDGRLQLDGIAVMPKAAPAAPSVAPAPAPAQPVVSTRVDPQAMIQELTALIAEKTGYDSSELEPDFELEADLGIDTVKQAEIFSEIREKHGLERDDSFRLADYPTIEALAGWLSAAIAGGSAGGEGPAAAPVAAVSPAVDVEPAPAAASPPPASSSSADPTAMLEELTALIAEKTGYETSELEPDFELEADLGIDTVKQAEIFSEIREKHGLDRDDDFRLAD